MWEKFKEAFEDKIIFILLVPMIGFIVMPFIELLTGNNPAIINIIFGIASSLLGALVGGFCSLAATIYACDQQLKITAKRDTALKMRDSYYIPIYLEISYTFGKFETPISREQSLEKLLCLEWEKIRYASKALGIPKEVQLTLEELRNSVIKYSSTEQDMSDSELWMIYRKICQRANKIIEERINVINQKYGF